MGLSPDGREACESAVDRPIFFKELRGKKQAGLFNLKSDEGEQQNVRTKHPEKFEELSKIYNQWMRRKKARQERHKKNEKY